METERSGFMEMSHSKQRILDESLKLFSIHGYEATSIGQIADAVGMRKSSLYSHFKSKQDILDTLIQKITEQYEAYIISAVAAWNDRKEEYEQGKAWTAEAIFELVKQQMDFLIHDSFFCMARRFLSIEQFRNPQLAAIQNKSEYLDMLEFHRELMQYFIEKDIFIDEGMEIMVYEFFSPIYVQFYHIQREQGCEEEAMRIVENHIKYIFKKYSK